MQNVASWFFFKYNNTNRSLNGNEESNETTRGWEPRLFEWACIRLSTPICSFLLQCVRVHAHMINILCLHTYIYIYIFFFSNRQFLSPRKKERGKGKRERKMEKWATKGFLKGSLPGRFLFNPSSTRSFAFVNSSFITVNERLSLFKAWRYTPRWLKCIARIFARIVWKKSKVCVDIVLRVHV